MANKTILQGTADSLGNTWLNTLSMVLLAEDARDKKYKKKCKKLKKKLKKLTP